MIDRIISRLDRLRPRGRDRWIACCPAHEDKSPSLSITDAGDRVLLHCFAGCDLQDVCAALGLEVWELFADGKPPREILPGVNRGDLLETYITELLICELADGDRAAAKVLTAADLERERLAREFVEASRGVVYG